MSAEVPVIRVQIEEVSEDGIDFLFEQLYRLHPGAMNDWLIAGKFIDEHKIELSHSADSAYEWSATVNDVDGLFMISGSTACIAVARLMLKKLLRESSGKQFALRMPLKTAAQFVDASENIDFIVAESSGTGVGDTVELELLADD